MGRTAWIGTTLDAIWQDLRLAARAIRRGPAVAAAIVATLALGIGANAAIFGVINGLLLRPLPVADPQRLVTISSDAALARGWSIGFAWSVKMWDALQPHASLFNGAAAWTPARFNLAERGERQLVDGIFASGDYFAMLGVPPLRGRTFTAMDDRPGGGAHGPVAVISHALWQRRFGAADVIGTPLVVDGVPVTIVGVMPRGFFGVDVGRAFDVALPLWTEPTIHRTRPSLQTLRLVVMLRLKPGQSMEAGTAALRAVQPQILGVTAEGMSTVTPARNQEPFTLASAATGTSLPFRGPIGLRQAYQRPLLTLLVVVLLVLLLTCLNIANLLVARAATRTHEIGVRLALGARQSRLLWQFLIESLVLAILGGIAGLLLAVWASQALVAQLSTPVNRIALELSLDWRILAFTAAVTVATAAIVGTAPARRAARMDPLEILRMRGHGTSAGRRVITLSRGLVVGQIALSFVLVVAAALFVRSFARLVHVPLGFDPDRVLLVSVDTEHARIDPSQRILLYARLVDAVSRTPGVAHAGGSIWTPVDGGMRMGDPRTHVTFNFVTPGWFAAYGTVIRLGRDFTVRDTMDAPPVAIVNQSFVHTLMPGRFPLGETIPYFRSTNGGTLRTIVGVVDDAVFESQREGIQPMAYVPLAQSAATGPNGLTEISIGVRPAIGAPMQLAASVAAAVKSVDPDVSFGFRLLMDHVQASVRQERLVALLSGIFGALALLIATLGLYGITAYAVNRRVTEIGIRIALGAHRVDVMKLVFGQTLTVAGLGIALGLVGAAAVTRSLQAMLFGVAPLDSTTFAGVAALFVMVAVLAAALPAHRASTVDPIVALRSE
jgi:putative ABC transport system permease protein